MDGHGGIAYRSSQHLRKLIDIGLEALPLCIHRRVSLQQQFAVHPGDFYRLIDQPHFGAHGNQREQRRHIVGIHPYATMGHRKPHGNGVVGAVDQVRAIARRQSHRVCAQRIIGAGRHPRRNGIARLGMFLSHRFRREPSGILLLGNDMGHAKRRAPIHLADAYRIGDDLDGTAALRLRIIVKPVLGQVDDDSLMGTGRQNVAPGNDEFYPGARQPGIHARVHSNQLLRSQAEFPGQIVKGVFVHRVDRLVLADDGRAGVGDGVYGGLGKIGTREQQKTGERGARSPGRADASMKAALRQLSS